MSLQPEPIGPVPEATARVAITNYLVLDDRTRTEAALSWLRESGIKPPAA